MTTNKGKSENKSVTALWTDVKAYVFKALRTGASKVLNTLLIVYFLTLYNSYYDGAIIKLLRGVPISRYEAEKKDTTFELKQFTEGKIYRSEDGLEEKEVIRCEIKMNSPGYLLVTAKARGKYRLDEKNCTVKQGVVEIYVYLDDRELAHGSVFVGDCSYRNDSKSLCTSTVLIEEIEANKEYDLKVIAVYYGSIERDDTRLAFFKLMDRVPYSQDH